MNELLDDLPQLERAWDEAAYRSAEATGIAIDDLNNPHAAVAVHDGQIVYIGISDSLLGVGGDQLTDILNGLILCAFSNWRAQLTGVASR